MPAAAVLTLALTLLALTPGAAEAVEPLNPPANATVSSTPTFSWRLGPGEQSLSIEVSPNPAPGDAGGFTDDNDKRLSLLSDTQTSFAVGDRMPLFPGVWFWHVSTSDPEFNNRWSVTRRIVVRDEPIELQTFKFSHVACARQMTVDFTYTDNSLNLPASFRVEFRRSRRGRRVASIPGRAAEGHLFRTFRRPRELRRGRRYYVRLKVRDARGHVDRSGFRRIRIRGC